MLESERRTEEKAHSVRLRGRLTSLLPSFLHSSNCTARHNIRHLASSSIQPYLFLSPSTPWSFQSLLPLMYFQIPSVKLNSNWILFHCTVFSVPWRSHGSRNLTASALETAAVRSRSEAGRNPSFLTSTNLPFYGSSCSRIVLH